MLPTLLIANLGCEDVLADRAQRLAARKHAAAYGSLLRALGTDGDTLWLPHELAPERLTPHLPRPQIVTGRVPEAEVTLPWCTAEAWGGDPAARLALKNPLVRRLWSVPRPDPRVTATVNHKAFALLLGRRWGEALPLAAAIADVSELKAHLRDFPPGARWVLKHPLAAAGRARIWGAGQSLSPQLCAKISRLLEGAGVLILEPWMERTRDVGRAGLVDDEGVSLLARYQQAIGPKGEFRGIGLEDPLPPAQR
ncbi:MAG: hypothetical protein JRH20_07295, partial [Deltaproteobacteria bacterium]|nr:hypothetical protein [Deltaproteobacteria bacterium]